MIAVDAWLRAEGLRSRLVLQVHDELILEAPVEEAELVRRKVPELMAAVASLSVPLVAEVGMGDSWGPRTDGFRSSSPRVDAKEKGGRENGPPFLEW